MTGGKSNRSLKVLALCAVSAILAFFCFQSFYNIAECSNEKRVDEDVTFSRIRVT